MTRGKLYPELQPIQIAYGVANNDLRPPIPSKMDKNLSKLIESCWQEDPTKRPSYSDILNSLNQIKEDLGLK
jgi:hypothetical protein